MIPRPETRNSKPETRNLKLILPQVVTIAEKAGEAVMEVYGQDDFATAYKSDDSPLTRADITSHEIILQQLCALTPDLPVLSEESESLPYAERQSWRALWLVDPLDGTKEFIKRNGEFTINIALVEDNRPVLGVVHAPALDVTYFAAESVGAFKKAAENQVRRIAVTHYRHMPLKIVTSRSHRGDRLERFLEKIGPFEHIRMGSSLKLCLVAEGAAHLYPRLGPTMEWDIAAAQCVVEMAGGTVTDLEGRTLKYNKPDLTNPRFIACRNTSTLIATRDTPLLASLASALKVLTADS